MWRTPNKLSCNLLFRVVCSKNHVMKHLKIHNMHYTKLRFMKNIFIMTSQNRPVISSEHKTRTCLLGTVNNASVRSSHRSCSVKICVLKNVTNFTWKHLCWSLFLTKLPAFEPATLLKRDSNTGAFLWVLRNVKSSFFIGNLRWLLLNLSPVLDKWYGFSWS